MKTNVSIKFNSIEEYREIEKKLVELGYKADNHFNIEKAHKYVYIGLRRKFLYVTHLGNEKVYNSLEEFLKD